MAYGRLKGPKGGSLNPKLRVVDAVSRCIFCGGGPLSDEHLIADWIGEIIGAGDKFHRGLHVYHAELGIDKLDIKRKRALIDRRLDVVCKSCNNGWMSHLQNEARSHLSNLIKGEEISLGTSSSTKIACWATMTSMVGEYDDAMRRFIAVSQEERSLLRIHQHPLPNWRFWFGRAKENLPTLFRHSTSQSCATIAPFRPLSGHKMKPDVQITILIAGRMFLYVFSSLYPEPYDFALKNYVREMIPGLSFTTVGLDEIGLDEVELLVENLERRISARNEHDRL